MRIIFTCLLFITIFLSKTTVSIAQVNTQDSLALVDLYNSTNGTAWTNHTNWLYNDFIPLDNSYNIILSVDVYLRIFIVFFLAKPNLQQ